MAPDGRAASAKTSITGTSKHQRGLHEAVRTDGATEWTDGGDTKVELFWGNKRTANERTKRRGEERRWLRHFSDDI